MVNFKMPRGPNSLVGNAPKPEERDGEYVSKKALRSAAGSVSLRVVANAEADGPARLHPACPLLAHADDRGVVHLVLEAGSDCVLRACAASSEYACPAGCLALSEEQRINVHVAEDQTASFKAFEPPFDAPTDLFDIELEVRLLRRGGPRRRGVGGATGTGAGTTKTTTPTTTPTKTTPLPRIPMRREDVSSTAAPSARLCGIACATAGSPRASCCASKPGTRANRNARTFCARAWRA